MAYTIRDVLADVRTKIEALVPTTEATKLFRLVVTYPTGAGGEDIPAPMAHRAVRVLRERSEPTYDVAGGTHVWDPVVVILELYHVWKRADAFEAETVHAEDVHMLTECLLFRRPGSTSGARIWRLDSEQRTVEGNRWRTRLAFSGRLAMPAVVTPA